MKPKLKLDKSENVFISDKYASNGHWLIVLDKLPKELKTLASLKPGAYREGISSERRIDAIPDLEAIIPKRDGYVALISQPLGVSFVGLSTEIRAYKYDTVAALGELTKTVGIAVKYVPLLSLGTAFAKGPTDPILVLSGPSLNDDLVAVVMPMRLNK